MQFIKKFYGQEVGYVAPRWFAVNEICPESLIEEAQKAGAVPKSDASKEAKKEFKKAK